MKQPKRRNWIIRISLLVIISAAVLAKPIYRIITNREDLSKKELTDYRNLFNKKTLNDLHLFNTIESRSREPESQYIYDNKFNLFVTRAHIPDSLNLKETVKFSNEVSKIKEDEVRFSIHSYNSEIEIYSAGIPLIKDIKFKIEGNNFHIVNSTENQVSFYFEFKTSSLVLNNNQTYIVLKTTRSNIPVNMSLVKKGNLLYFVMMTGAADNVAVSREELFNILDKQ